MGQRNTSCHRVNATLLIIQLVLKRVLRAYRLGSARVWYAPWEQPVLCPAPVFGHFHYCRHLFPNNAPGLALSRS